MPDLLTSYLAELDNGSADVTENSTITSRLGEIATQLDTAGQAEPARLARIEQEVLAASKTLDKKVGYRVSFTREDENGLTQEYGWPDTAGYGLPEYDYLKKRFSTTANPYLKSEYGFFLYLRDQRKRQDEVAEMVTVFFYLSQQYFKQALTESERNHYVIHAVQALVLAFKLAVSRQSHPPTVALLRSIAEFWLEKQQTWNPERHGTLLLFATLTEVMTEYPAPFQQAGNALAYLEKNRQTVAALAQSYRYGAMELAQATATLAARLKLDPRPWHLLTAAQYEALAEEAEKQDNSAATVFLENAQRLYSEWGDPQAAERVAQQYQRLRTQFPLATIRTPYPVEVMEAQRAGILADVARYSEAELMALIAATPMFPAVAAVRERAATREQLFTDTLPVAVQDKHGNTIQQFTTGQEIAQFQLFKDYELLGQLATHTLVDLMLEAYGAGKLTAAGVLHYLEESWLGKSRPMQGHGRRHETSPLRLLASGIGAMFAELGRWHAGQTDEPDFIAATDSLTLKVEYILRYICDKLGIVTFRPHPKKTGVVMEKLLDELIRDLDKHLDPDDLFFIKYYLHEKAGRNLRNRVAHGLMDDEEYGVENAFLVLVMILKLANYEFKSIAP